MKIDHMMPRCWTWSEISPDSAVPLRSWFFRIVFSHTKLPVRKQASQTPLSMTGSAPNERRLLGEHNGTFSCCSGSCFPQELVETKKGARRETWISIGLTSIRMLTLLCFCWIYKHHVNCHTSLIVRVNKIDITNPVLVDILSSCLNLPSFLLLSRYRLRLFCDCVATERLLHCDLGLGTLLPVSVLSAGASLGKMQAALEHRKLYRGHRPQEQDLVASSQHYQLYLPRH